VLDRFAIDYGLCLYCGICVEVCPFDALFWSPETDYAADVLGGLVQEKDRLGEWLSSAPGAQAPGGTDEAGGAVS
jgi:NADH-quinone oxidoreductase subunit I